MKFRGACLVVGCLSFGVLPNAPALASSSLISVSTDGTAFAPTADTALFSGAGAVVPGDVLSDDVWVRSDATAPGHLRLDIMSLMSTDPRLTSSVTMNIAADGQNWEIPFADVADAEGCYIAATGIGLAPGEVVHIEAALHVDRAMGDDGSDAGQLADLSFTVRAVLSDASVDTGESPGDTCDAVVPTTPSVTATPSAPDPVAGGEDLSNTGAEVAWALALVGGAATLLGIVLFAARRARRTEGVRDA